MKFLYGVEDKYIDITSKFKLGQSMFIEEGDDLRLKLAGQDPAPGIHKHIVVMNGEEVIYVPDNSNLLIKEINGVYRFKQISPAKNTISIYEKLQFTEELLIHPPQLTLLHKMLTLFISPDDIVLELGAYTGVSSCIISTILDQGKLVCLERNPLVVPILSKMRNLNNFNFDILSVAISNIKLMARKYNNPCSPIPPRSPAFPCLNNLPNDGWEEINTITWDSFKSAAMFNVLVADCDEGLYYAIDILKSPLLMTVIMVNDYHDMYKRNTVVESLKKNGFHCIYRVHGGWGPCKDSFYEVWESNRQIPAK